MLYAQETILFSSYIWYIDKGLVRGMWICNVHLINGLPLHIKRRRIFSGCVVLVSFLLKWWIVGGGSRKVIIYIRILSSCNYSKSYFYLDYSASLWLAVIVELSVCSTHLLCYLNYYPRQSMLFNGKCLAVGSLIGYHPQQVFLLVN